MDVNPPTVDPTEAKQRVSILVAEFSPTVPAAKELLEMLGLPPTKVTEVDQR